MTESLEGQKDLRASGARSDGSARTQRAGERPKPARGEAFGILNPYGELWTWQTFSSEKWAAHYIADFWRGNKNAPDLSEFRVIPVRVTVSALPQPRNPQAAGEGSPTSTDKGSSQ